MLCAVSAACRGTKGLKSHPAGTVSCVLLHGKQGHTWTPCSSTACHGGGISAKLRPRLPCGLAPPWESGSLMLRTDLHDSRHLPLKCTPQLRTINHVHNR